MKKTAAALALALSLAACGGSTTANEAAANDVLGNETVLNDEVAIDENAAAIDNSLGAAGAVDPLGNGAQNVLTPADNAL